MKFPITPDENHEFYQYLHLHATGYDFEGGYKLRRNVDLIAPGLWYVEDNIGFRLTSEGMWLGQPREEEAYVNWVSDTSHEFMDVWAMLQDDGILVPALRRPRPTPARVT